MTDAKPDIRSLSIEALQASGFPVEQIEDEIERRLEVAARDGQEEAERLARETFSGNSDKSKEASPVEPAEQGGHRDGETVIQLAELLRMTAATIRRYVALSDDQRDAIALWVAHAYVIEATSTTPYLHVTSAIEESGKTRLLETLEILVPGPLFAAGLSPAVAYRVVDELQPTLLVDEIDNSLKKKSDDNNDMYAVINAGYRRGAVVYRMGGQRMTELQSFSPFCPKALAGIGRIDPTLASRCLRIVLDRRDPSEKIEDFYRDDAYAEAQPIRGGFETWATSEVVAQLKAIRPMKLGVRDRQEESLRLLLAIAQVAGEKWPARGRSALKALATASSDDARSTGVDLLADIRRIMAGAPHITTVELLQGLFDSEEHPWREWWAERDRDGQFVPSKGGPSGLARRLRAFGVRPKKIRVGDWTLRGYTLEDFSPSWTRYLKPETPEQEAPAPVPTPTPNPEQAEQAEQPHG